MTHEPDPDAWARLRLAIIGSLLAAPSKRGELKHGIASLATRLWRHPINGTRICFGVSTIEAWYYQARSSADPVGTLRRQRRVDAARGRSLDTDLIDAIYAQDRCDPDWCMQMHSDIAMGDADSPPFKIQ